jgi:hypothetical protein
VITITPSPLIHFLTKACFAPPSVFQVALSDKVLVVDAGRAAEFGAPSALLRNPNSHFHALWHGKKKIPGSLE